MTIKYCSWTSGSDDTGDGSNTSPYKTITKASTGLGAGDEVRVEKSPDNTDLTGTLSFTNGSTAVTGSGTSFTTELALGDFIKGGDGNWWEVVTITDDTHLTLFRKYSGATQSGVSSQKLGLTCTGAADSSSTVIQEVSSSGSSTDFLYITGGWNLSTQTQTGVTNFQQLHGTFANRYGYGLQLSGKTYVKVEKLNFFRYYSGVYLNSSSNNSFSSVTCNSNSSHGVYLISSSNNSFSSVTCNSNNYGVQLYYSNNNSFSSVTCNSNDYGVQLYYSSNNSFSSVTCNSNNTGVQLSSSNNNSFSSVTCNSNNRGVYFDACSDNIFRGTYNSSGNAMGSIYISGFVNYFLKAIISETTKVEIGDTFRNTRVYINNIGGYSQIWADGGNIISQDATAGGSGKEWKFNITSSNRSSIYPLKLEVAQIAVVANKQVTVKLYFKKSGTGIAGKLCLPGGQIAGVDDDVSQTCPDNTDRNQVQIQFTPTEAGVVSVEAWAWYVSSTSQSLIIDDIDITQAD